MRKRMFVFTSAVYRWLVDVRESEGEGEYECERACECEVSKHL